MVIETKLPVQSGFLTMFVFLKLVRAAKFQVQAKTKRGTAYAIPLFYIANYG